MRSEIQQLIADLRLQDQVFLKGTLTLDQVAAAMVDADLGIVPKRNDSFGGEAFSTKILEFMALGVPIVVAATRIDRFYFNDSIVRFFEPENVQDLALAINDMIRNRELRERLSASAMDFVSDFTWDKKEKEYLSLVGSLMSVGG